ncbi:unnamed protein product, partial [marine sediment metagenome]
QEKSKIEKNSAGGKCYCRRAKGNNMIRLGTIVFGERKYEN